MKGVVSFLSDTGPDKASWQGDGFLSVSFNDGDTSIILTKEEAVRMAKLITAALPAASYAGKRMIRFDGELHGHEYAVLAEPGYTDLSNGVSYLDGSYTVRSVIDDDGTDILDFLKNFSPESIDQLEAQAVEYVKGKREMLGEDKWNEEHGK